MKSGLENLTIYTTSINLVVKVYVLTRSFHNDFSLCDQLKRSAVSVPTNISEGYFRGVKQSKNYLKIASGSANEVITLLKITQLVYKIETLSLQNQYEVLCKQISSFAKSF